VARELDTGHRIKHEHLAIENSLPDRVNVWPERLDLARLDTGKRVTEAYDLEHLRARPKIRSADRGRRSGVPVVRGDEGIAELLPRNSGPLERHCGGRIAEIISGRALSRSRAINVGAGGAAAFVKDMARAGVGEHIHIDPDLVSASNLATQQT
jgi:hypothetical protein